MIHIYINMCTHTIICAEISFSICICVCVCVYRYRNTAIEGQIRTDIDIHIHIYRCMDAEVDKMQKHGSMEVYVDT